MVATNQRFSVYLLLGCLVVLDLVLSIASLFFPEWWYQTIHGVSYVDPQGLLKRTGAIWVAFTVLQLIAFFQWERSPWWLVLIAGVRFTELFSEWTYLYFAKDVTFGGRLGLFVAPIANLVFGWFLIRSSFKVTRNGAVRE